MLQLVLVRWRIQLKLCILCTMVDVIQQKYGHPSMGTPILRDYSQRILTYIMRVFYYWT